jgi:PAS domain S-box-containing protein
VIRKILGTTIAIVGGGRACRTFLEFLTDEVFTGQVPEILGVADIQADAVGMQRAGALKIPTFTDYTELYRQPRLQTLLELTNSSAIIETIRQTKPEGLRFIDRFEARAIRDYLQVEKVKLESSRELQRVKHDPESIQELYHVLVDRFSAIIERRNRRSHEIERELIDKERTLYQIIQGSTIPTFVINQDHFITHWNRALEKLSGVSAEQAIGTTRQWAPFYSSPRPSMADVVLDQISEEDIRRLYGNTWRKSLLIDEGYEAEGFFPNLGQDGKWCWFTAAPIKSPDGRVIGAIETLWDKTEDKRAEQERERHTAELSAMVAITTALNTPAPLEERVRSALNELQTLIGGDGICLFLSGEDGRYHLKLACGASEEACRILPVAEANSAIAHVGRTQHFRAYEELPIDCTDEIRFLENKELGFISYLPIRAKEKENFGVIRIGSRKPQNITGRLRNVLALIGNRIAAAIENDLLQEQVIKSEEKYRTLFDRDPNPIFILTPYAFQVLDTNQTAQTTYGYERAELVEKSFLLLGDENDEEVKDGLNNLSQNQSVLFTKKRHFRKDGGAFFVNVNVSRAEYGGRDVLIATTTNITEMIEREAQLIQAGKMTTLGVMAAGMAHEINQPLNVIQLSADYLLKMLDRSPGLEVEEIKRVAADIATSVERASSVITHVRAFSRQAEFTRSRVNLNDPIRDVFKILGHQLKAHEIELELDLAPDLPSVLADHNRLEQVFVNLVSNAIDAIDEKSAAGAGDGDRRITIRSFKEGDRVVAEVSDTGVGMTEDVKNKLFEPFFTTKKVGKGTGLGTSISYGIIREYQGTIDIRSRPGRGATFRLMFPLAR